MYVNDIQERAPVNGDIQERAHVNSAAEFRIRDNKRHSQFYRKRNLCLPDLYRTPTVFSGLSPCLSISSRKPITVPKVWYLLPESDRRTPPLESPGTGGFPGGA
ncbi:uncharacterized protein LOC143027639 isoform X2 [Oratosquilla oratoria]|uniref:uncharacterized protein LOC143027639 isoform X2 n=1 Tax=Oratosquilla oratoria TaxID=337810 RepID=UPI003F76835D